MKTTKDMPEHSRPHGKLRERGASALPDEKIVSTNTVIVIIAPGAMQRSQKPYRFRKSWYEEQTTT